VNRTLLLVSMTASLLAGLGTFVAATVIDETGLWPATTAVGLCMALASVPISAAVLPRVERAGIDALPALASLVVAAGAFKAVIAAAGVLVLVKLGDRPTWATFGFVASWYVLLTLAQASVSGLAFWRRDALANLETPSAEANVPAPPP
jgi:hypothetical protein